MPTNAIRIKTPSGWRDIAVQGAQGIQGPPGSAGATGAQGTPGEKWFSQAGAPAGATGIVGDWSLDTTTGDIYEKTGASAWTLRGNIRGPQGATGSQGPQGTTGAQGTQGVAGTPGEKWFTQAGAPAGATGIVGDWSLDSTTGDYYEKTGASAWTLRGNLKGPQGATGATGAASTVPGPQGATGPQGTTGPQGATGTTGAQGPQGDIGPQGPQGIQGVGAGMHIWTGYGPPPANVGVKDDWWLDVQTNTLYGPKATWPDTPGQLIPNPSLETDLAGWVTTSSVPSGSRIFAREATWARHGNWSLHSLITRDVQTAVTVQPVGNGLASVPIDPAKKYSLQVYQRLRRSSFVESPTGYTVRLTWYDAAGTQVSAGGALGYLNGAANDVIVHTHENLTPFAGSAFLRPYLYGSVVAGGSWEADIDAFVVFEGATLPISWPTTGIDLDSPTGAAGGDLAGTYPNPGIAPGVIVDGDVSATAAIAQSKLALAVDAAAATASLRTLGTGATQAVAGNDARLAAFVSGSGAPGAGVGVDGSIYLDVSTGRMYGPKAAGAWPSVPIGVLVTDAMTYKIESAGS